MAINKKLIHFKKFSDFNSKKLSANEANTQYTVGVGGTIQNGTPDVLYQSICWIKDTKQQWTHGQLYDFSDSDIYYTDFTADDVYLGYQGEGGNPIVVTQDLLDAINDNKVIIVPAGSTRSGYNMLYGKTDSEYSYRLAFIGASETIIYNMDARDLTGGYVVDLASEGFITEIAYAPVNVGVDANSVVRRDDTGSINVIFLRDSAGKLCGLPTGNATEEAVGDYTLQDKLISGKNIKTVNGQTLLGSGDITISGGNTDPQYYVMTSYSFEDILNLAADGHTGWYSQNSGDFMNITNAFTQKIPVYIERNADDAYKSLIPVTGYAEDLLYLTITDGEITIYMECSINGDWEEASWSIYSFSDVQQQLSDKVGFDDLAKVASSGSYNDLTDKPTIPSAVTESTVSGWGFTKNTGTYSKPSGGIPKTDLASAVQTSLGKADTALQSYTEQYKGTITGVSANGTSVATSGVANIPAASTSAYGVTKLSSATNSTSTTLAATASAVKAAYDLANSYKGTVTGVKINGTTKNPSSGIVDLGTVITAHQTLKTINGQSIIGSGNITISGGSGSSSGSGAYPEVNHGTSDTTFALTPNTFHIWDEIGTLDVSLGAETTGVANEYLFQFTSGSEPTSLILSGDIKWANDEAPTIQPNKIYQISILKGLGSVMSWNNANTALIENHITYDAGNFMDGATIIFEYPTASELTFSMSYYHGNTLIVPQGSTQVNVDWDEPTAPAIRSFSPPEDSTYKYILQ